jgi:hypothetical protein
MYSARYSRKSLENIIVQPEFKLVLADEDNIAIRVVELALPVDLKGQSLLGRFSC